MYYSRKQITIIVMSILLFIAGRFYKELDELFCNSASIIGLLFSIIGIMASNLVWLRFKLEKRNYEISKAYNDCEEYRRKMRDDSDKIKKLEYKSFELTVQNNQYERIMNGLRTSLNAKHIDYCEMKKQLLELQIKTKKK